jgi:hypothetical protein
MKKIGISLIWIIVIFLLLVTSCVTRQVPVVETYTETEYRTEYQTETYTETVNEVISSKEGTTYLSPRMKWYTNLLIPGFEGQGGTYYYDYVVTPSHSKNQVQITLSSNAQFDNGVVRVYNLTSFGPIPPQPTPFKQGFYQPYMSVIDWINNLNTVLSAAPLLGQVQLGPGAPGQIVFDANGVIEFSVFATTWDAYAVQSVKLLWTDEVTGQKTVTGERQVPYQVPYQVEKQRTVYKTESVPFWQGF